MKKVISVLCVIAVLVSCFTMSAFAEAEKAGKLSFSEDGKFTVLQLSDPQDDQYPAHEMERFVKKALEKSQPDLVVISGDLVEDTRFGDIGSDDKNMQEGVLVDGDYEKTLENVKTAVSYIFAPLEEAGVFYTVAQGNNDYKSNISNEDWLKIYASYPHCLVVDESDDEAGKIDSYLEIKKHNSDEAGFGIWLLDNGRGFTDGQREWFKNKETSDVPSIVFEHIPIKDVGNLFEKCNFWDSGALLGDGINTYRLNPEVASGVNYVVYEPTEKPTDDFLMFKDKGVTGAFFGHIHTDGYTGTYEGMTLGLTYGYQFAKAGPYGYRVLELDEDGTFTTDLYTYSDGEFNLQTDEAVIEESIGQKIINAVSFIFRQICAWLKF